MTFDRRTRRTAATTLIAGTAGALAIGAAFPAVARGAVVAVTSVSCSVTGSNWCISGNDSSSGIGVIGTSKTGTGLRGTSTSQYGLKATSSSNYAILAQTTSGKAAISATAGSGYGVFGVATKTGGIGLYGSSLDGYGAYGTTSSGSGYGVVGVVSGSGTGLYGASSTGNGTETYSENGGNALYAQASGSGDGAQIASNTGYGTIVRSAGSVAVFATNSNGNATDVSGSYIGLLGRAPASGGFPLVLTDTNSKNVFFVNGTGDVVYSGSLVHSSAIGHQQTLKSYGSDATEPVVEDTGTAHLTNGAAAVRLDRPFASAIEANGAYRVFVTPNGDTRGLFVASKTVDGFVVREAQGGRSTVTFDYRIVATARGRVGQRMAITTDAAVATFQPRAARPIPPAQRIPKRLSAEPTLPSAL